MYYRPGTGRRFWPLQMHVCAFPGGSTCLREMIPWPPSWTYDVKSKLRLVNRCLIYTKNIRAKFHPDLVWNGGASGFFWNDRSNNKKKNKNSNKMSSDMKSVPDLKQPRLDRIRVYAKIEYVSVRTYLSKNRIRTLRILEPWKQQFINVRMCRNAYKCVGIRE